MKVEKPRLQIILIVIVLDLPVGIDSMPHTRASKLKLKESRHSKIIWHEDGGNSPVGSYSGCLWTKASQYLNSIMILS